MMRARVISVLAALLFAQWTASSRVATAAERDYISLIGLPQVLKYAVSVTMAIHDRSRQKFPLIINSTTNDGPKLFCSGLGENRPDLFIMDTLPNDNPLEDCEHNGVNRVARLPIGREALVFTIAAGQKPFDVSARTMYLALAARLPLAGEESAAESNPLGTTFVANRYQRWNQIDPKLPDMPIRLLAPPDHSVEWWAINDMIMLDGCRAVRSVALIEATDLQLFRQLCYSRRKDGTIVYADGQKYADNPVVIPTETSDVVIGTFRLPGEAKGSFPLPVDGVLPSEASIMDGSYHVARLVVAYVKTEKYNIVPGFREFTMEMTSPQAAAEGGYMTKLGLVPLPQTELRESGAAARALAAGR